MHELEAAKRLIFYVETKEKSCFDFAAFLSDDRLLIWPRVKHFISSLPTAKLRR